MWNGRRLTMTSCSTRKRNAICLREIGFEQVDIYFRMTEVAIFAGVKGRE
jgi:hypothetical protein